MCYNLVVSAGDVAVRNPITFFWGVNAMRKLSVLIAMFVLVLGVSVALVPDVAQAAPGDDACWGQATKVFAQMGVMGEHASGQENPRLGLRNLARALYDLGVLPDDSMQSLGAFVAQELSLGVDACM